MRGSFEMLSDFSEVTYLVSRRASPAPRSVPKVFAVDHCAQTAGAVRRQQSVAQICAWSGLCFAVLMLLVENTFLLPAN